MLERGECGGDILAVALQPGRFRVRLLDDWQNDQRRHGEKY